MNSMSLPDVHKFILKSISMFCFSLNPPNPNFSSDFAHMHGNPTTHLIMQGIRIIGSIGSEPAPSSPHTAKLHMFPQVGDSEKMVKTWKNSTMWHTFIDCDAAAVGEILSSCTMKPTRVWKNWWKYLYWVCSLLILNHTVAKVVWRGLGCCSRVFIHVQQG